MNYQSHGEVSPQVLTSVTIRTEGGRVLACLLHRQGECQDQKKALNSST